MSTEFVTIEENNAIEYSVSEKSSVMNSVDDHMNDQFQEKSRQTSFKNSHTNGYIYNYGRHNEEPASFTGSSVPKNFNLTEIRATDVRKQSKEKSSSGSKELNSSYLDKKTVRKFEQMLGEDIHDDDLPN